MKINILHLSDGSHYFEETIASNKFKNISHDIYTNDISIKVELNKFEKNLNCKMQLSTISYFLCDRCLEKVEREIVSNCHILFHYNSDDLISEEDNVVILTNDQVEIDLTSFIEEYLTLAIPMKILCREDCKGICAGCGADLNSEYCRCDHQSIDPRWQKLKDFMEN